MGAAGSNPFDETARKELKEVIDRTVKEFTLQYTLALAVCLVKKAEEDLEKKDEKEVKSQRQLETDPDPPKDARKEGYMIKQGAVRKNWLQRYFTINHDYSISYKVKKEDAKEKGRFTLGGYWVRDWNNKDKPFTIHCEHYNKRNWYFQVPAPENKDVKHEDEYNKWKEALQAAARNAPSPMTTDKMLRRVYQRAYLKTYERWWGWSSYFYCTGSEAEMMGDLIYRQLRWDLLWRVKNNIKAPHPKIRQKISETIDSQVKVAVDAATKAGWEAICKAREAAMPEMEKKIKENGGPIFEQKKKVKDTLREKLMEIVNPLLDKTVKPIVENCFGKVFTPIADAHVESLKGFKRCVDWYTNSDGNKEYKPETIRRMNYWAYWYLWEARRIMWNMESDETVRKALTPPSSGVSSGADSSGDKKEEASNAYIAYRINDELSDQVLAAIFTLGKDKDLKVVMGKFINDSKILLREQYKAFILGVLEPNVMAVASKTILELAKPIDEAIPDIVKQFVNAHDTCVEILKLMCNDVAEAFLQASFEKECARMVQELEKVAA